MKIYTLNREQTIDTPRESVFAFFENPENLARITPSNLDFRIMTPTPIEMKIGAVIDYTIKIAGLRFHWRTIITSYDPPSGFVDEQLKGPYVFWHHRHTFVSTVEGMAIRDTVTYALPFGIVGRLAHALFVRRRLGLIFDYRSNAIKSIFNQK